jgi:hypothetical protein
MNDAKRNHREVGNEHSPAGAAGPLAAARTLRARLRELESATAPPTLLARTLDAVGL